MHQSGHRMNQQQQAEPPELPPTSSQPLLHHHSHGSSSSSSLLEENARLRQQLEIATANERATLARYFKIKARRL